MPPWQKDPEIDGLALVRAAIETLHGDIALISSFGAESAVLLDMVATVERLRDEYRARYRAAEDAGAGEAAAE